MLNIFELLDGSSPLIRIIDVGAMRAPGTSEPYDPLLKHDSVKIIGFEPVQAECDKLNALRSTGRLYLPYVIGDGRRRVFHENNSVMTSSLYEPNTELLSQFQNLENFVRVVSRTEVATHRLDDLREVAGADYLKVDVQGAEVDVFNGAANVLKEAVMVQAEVEFVPLYRNQPLFSDVDQELRRHGFLFHRFAAAEGRVFKPLVFNNDLNAPGSQVLWADAVYMKDFMALDGISPEKLLKLAILLHVLYQSVDACAYVLRCYQDRTGDRLADRYVQRLMGKAS